MVFGVVLAGGIGSRMGNTEKPKQFLHIGAKPIIVHTVEKFMINDRFEKVIVLTPADWISYTKDLLAKYLPKDSNVVVIEGGKQRNDTIMNAISYIDENYGVDDNTCVVTHDAVRPFVTQRIIDENIDSVLEGCACDTAVPATDTIVEAKDGNIIDQVPNRAYYYQGQTPQSFNAAKFVELFESLSEEEKDTLTDAAKVFVMKGEKVVLVQGETFNIKVTYPYDLQLAETLLRGDK